MDWKKASKDITFLSAGVPGSSVGVSLLAVGLVDFAPPLVVIGGLTTCGSIYMLTQMSWLGCNYGIEYVDDPATGKKIPTCHRASYDSIIADDDYKSALEYADLSQRALYEEQAKDSDNKHEIKEEKGKTESDYTSADLYAFIASP